MPFGFRHGCGALLCAFLFASAVHAEDWQRKAVELYPQLGVSGSDFNKKFWGLYQQRRQTNPAYFSIPQWPVLLARECEAQLKSQPAKTPSAAVAAASPAAGASSSEASEMLAGRKLLVAKCGRCHEPPNPRVDEMQWNRWVWKWRGRAQLSDDEYDQLNAYARRLRESPPPSPAPGTPQESPEMAAGRQLFQQKCCTCHDVPSPSRVEPTKWEEWMNKMRGKAHLTDAEYEQIMAYAAKKREAYMQLVH
jgi:cytochrome c2